MLKGGAVAAGALSAPMIANARTAAWRFQSAWPAKDIFHEHTNDFAKKVSGMAGGRLNIELLPADAVVPAFQLLEAVGMNLSKTERLIVSQVISSSLADRCNGPRSSSSSWPIFIPLLDNFGVDPLFFGLLVALNLQTAFLSPPVAMSASCLQGVGSPHVTLNQIFAGMLPSMGSRWSPSSCSTSCRPLVCGCLWLPVAA